MTYPACPPVRLRSCSCVPSKPLKARIAEAFRDSTLSKSDLARLADVDASQVVRIVGGDFKTFSNHVIQICRVLHVEVPQLTAPLKADTEWAKTEATLKRIHSKKPESAVLVRRVLDAIADLHGADPPDLEALAQTPGKQLKRALVLPTPGSTAGSGDDRRGVNRVEPICRVLPIAPSTHPTTSPSRPIPRRCRRGRSGTWRLGVRSIT